MNAARAGANLRNKGLEDLTSKLSVNSDKPEQGDDSAEEKEEDTDVNSEFWPILIVLQ